MPYYNPHMDVSENSGFFPPKSSMLIGFSIINHPFWGVSPYFWKHPYNWVDVDPLNTLNIPKQPGF